MNKNSCGVMMLVVWKWLSAWLSAVLVADKIAKVWLQGKQAYLWG